MIKWIQEVTIREVHRLYAEGSEIMNYNNRNNPRVYYSGCSLFGCLTALFMFSILIQGSFYLLFEYFWLIIVLGLVVWVFRKFFKSETKKPENTNKQKKSWDRNFENQKDTSFHNLEREFEEIDDEDEEKF